MIKGVNKQIVEINCTRDEYIEKAILFINPQKGRLPKNIMDERAQDFLKTLLPAQVKPVQNPLLRLLRRPIFWVLLFGGAFLITALVLLLLLL